jgi:glycerol-3-phosphate acyltransferase PlsY
MQNYIPLIVAYFVGAIPFGLLVGKMAGVDVREHGSKNIGFTNVLRVCGAGWGVPVLVLDVLKGFIPVWAVNAGWLAVDKDKFTIVIAATALLTIMGHVLPVYLKFKGGKGVATSAGAFLALFPQATAIALAVFAVSLFIFRYVSLSSTLGAVAIVVAHHITEPEAFAEKLPLTIIAWLVMIIVIIRHRTNYVRLFNGTENKIGKARKT